MDFDRKKRRKFGDFFGDFDRIEDLMDSIFHDMLERSSFDDRRRPGIFGMSINFGPNGKPSIEEFGNIKPSAQGGRNMIADAREPLVDIIDSKKDSVVTAELPGVEEKEINVKLQDKTLVISTSGERVFHKEIELKARPKALKKKFKNGILEICLTKK